MNVSSVLVMVMPEYITVVIDDLKKINTLEYHMHDAIGKIIVTIEGKDLDEEIKLLKEIKTTNHVVSAEIMYSYSEDELDELRANLDQSVEVPEWLNKDNVKAEDISYHGDLKKKII